jgi:rhodanese-related sulfurtransferase
MTTLDEMLERSRARLHRLSPADARAAVERGAVLIDIRSEAQRERDGVVAEAMCFERNVLEWRCAPSSAARDARLQPADGLLIVMCDEGYQSSLAAATLQELGLPGATDMEGGFQAWRAAGLPVANRSAAHAREV